MKNLKTILFNSTVLIFGLLVTFNSYSQSQSWSWARSVSGEADNVGNSVATDAGGNIYVTGSFQSDISFGTIKLTNGSSEDNVYIVKYDPTGKAIWAKSAESGSAAGLSVAVDGYGNVYITGSFTSDSIIFGKFTLKNYYNGWCIFIVKYDLNGNVIWAKSAGGQEDFGIGLVTDESGNLYVTGSFQGDISFGNITLINNGESDIFIVKYDSNGNVLWAKNSGGDDYDNGKSICTDPSGNIIITGNFRSPRINFGTTSISNLIQGASVEFVVKYNPNGDVLWAKSAGGNGDNEGNSICTDPSGNIYATGFFNSPSIKFGATTLYNSGSDDFFITKYDRNGNVLWAKSAVGTTDDKGIGIAADEIGNIYATGIFASSSISFGTTDLNNAGGADIFIVKYDSNGNVLMASAIGGSDDDEGLSIATDGSGNIYLTGDYTSSSIKFGTHSVSNSFTGTAAIFLARLNYHTSGISEIRDELNFQIFPNPSSGIFYISGLGLLKCKVKIYTLNGQCILQSVKNDCQLLIDLSDQPKGIYFYQLQNDKEVLKTGKIVID